MRTITRIARRLVRKLIKPVALWWTNWQLKQSREDVDYFESFRVLLAKKEHEQHVRQLCLKMRQREIEGW